MNRLPFLNKILIFYQKHAQIANNLGWLFFDKVLRMGVGLVVGVWVARYLGVQDFGALNYAMAIVAITGVFATMGIESLVVKKLIEAPKFKNEILTTAFFIKLFGAIAGLATTVLYCCFANESLTLPLILSIGTLFLAMDVVDYYNQSKINSKIIVILRSISFIIASALKVIAIINLLPLFYFAIIFSFEFFIAFILMYFSMKDTFLKFNNFSISIAKEFLKNGFPLLLASFTVMIYMKIDQVLLGKLKGNEDLGIYSAAIKIAEMVYIIPTMFCSTIYPKIIASLNESNLKFEELIKKIFFSLFWMAIIISIITYFLSDFILNILYGNQFAASSNVLKIVCFSNVFVFVGVIMNYLLIALNLTKISLYKTVITGIFALILNLILINKYGYFGAAVSLLATQFCNIFIIYLFKDSKQPFLLMTKSIFKFK